MGFHQGDWVRRQGTRQSAWILPGLVAGLCAALAIAGDPARAWLRYDRQGIADGEFWRLVTGHFVHLGWSHFILNLLGLLLIWYLVGSHLRVTNWLLISLVAIIGIDLGFWLFEPQLVWYVGLSGLLHALLAAGVVGGYSNARAESLLLALVLLGKLAYEQISGPLPGSEQSTGGAVVVAAHLYGAIAGAFAAAIFAIRSRPRRSI